MPALVDAVSKRATLGEIVTALKDDLRRVPAGN